MQQELERRLGRAPAHSMMKVMSSSASRVWTTSGRPFSSRRRDVGGEHLALDGPGG